MIGAVILAAGAGTRLGGVAKALLPHAGQTYLAAIAAMARGVGLVDAVVVVGEPFAREVSAEARRLQLRVRVNPDPSRGMASSVALGFAAIANGPAAAAWLWPVDHPFIQAATLVQLRDALGEHAVVQPRFAGQGGHPPLVARRVWPALAACAGSRARDVLHAAGMVAIDVDDPGVVRDVDVPADREVQP